MTTFLVKQYCNCNIYISATRHNLKLILTLVAKIIEDITVINMRRIICIVPLLESIILENNIKV